MKTATSLKPCALGLAPSFGFGDRLGLATPGHLEALRCEGGPIKGIFAQQSIREMSRTRRTPAEVLTAAAQALATERFGDNWGADADHLKTEHDVDITAKAGFVFYTIDPSDHVDGGADTYDPTTLSARFDAVRAEVPWVDQYTGTTVSVKDGPQITFDAAVVQRAAVKYGSALARALELANHIAKTCETRGQEYEIELSVDETPHPTTLAEHYIIADQCRQAQIKLVSLAPRYMGDFEKGVDYKGDLTVLEHSIEQHAAVARELGPYKLSLHSGSDKLSMYAAFARATRGRFHVKTAGTSYLEALRVVARHDELMWRRIIDFARSRYDTEKATYHVSAAVKDVPAPADVGDSYELEQIYLECWHDLRRSYHSPDRGFTNPGRQILHCTFGSVLTDGKLGPAVRALLVDEQDTYRQVLTEHFSQHLAALRRGMEAT